MTRPYTGPFRVVTKTEKYFEIELNAKIDKVTVDRLKPAHLESSTEPAIVCYGPSIKSRDKNTEELKSDPTQPRQNAAETKKRGRPTRAMLDERQRLAADEEDARARDQVEWSVPTRSGRISRPPDRL